MDRSTVLGRRPPPCAAALPFLASIAGHRVTGYADLGEACADLHYVTVLREPQKLCASRFQYRLDHRHRYDLSFDRWIEEDWVRNAQTQRIAGVPDAHEAIRIIEDKEMFVGLTERFDESMVLLRSLRADDLDISYAPVNVAKRNTLAADLLSDARTRAMLAEANEADLELYRYVVDELYPRFRRAYGPPWTVPSRPIAARNGLGSTEATWSVSA